MSPRAACRLEQLGFTEVYDYSAGKADWLAHGLDTAGTQAGVLRARHALRGDVATAALDERVGEVRTRVATSPYGFALVVAADGTLVGPAARRRARWRPGRARRAGHGGGPVDGAARPAA